MSVENNKNFTDLKEETEKFKIETGKEKKKVLVIDDNKTDLVTAKSMLDSNYDVVTADSGTAALKLFHTGFVPNAILLDLIMPGMSGWDTFERIKKIGSVHNVAIIIYSASSDPDDNERARKMGAVDFVKKPAVMDGLLSVIRRAIGI